MRASSDPRENLTGGRPNPVSAPREAELRGASRAQQACLFLATVLEAVCGIGACPPSSWLGRNGPGQKPLLAKSIETSRSPASCRRSTWAADQPEPRAAPAASPRCDGRPRWSRTRAFLVALAALCSSSPAASVARRAASRRHHLCGGALQIRRRGRWADPYRPRPPVFSSPLRRRARVPLLEPLSGRPYPDGDLRELSVSLRTVSLITSGSGSRGRDVPRFKSLDTAASLRALLELTGAPRAMWRRGGLLGAGRVKRGASPPRFVPSSAARPGASAQASGAKEGTRPLKPVKTDLTAGLPQVEP